MSLCNAATCNAATQIHFVTANKNPWAHVRTGGLLYLTALSDSPALGGPDVLSAAGNNQSEVSRYDVTATIMPFVE